MKNIFYLLLILGYQFFHEVFLAQTEIKRIHSYQDKTSFFKQQGEWDSVIFYENKVLNLSKRIKYKVGISDACSTLGLAYKLKGEFPKALYFLYKALKIYEEAGDNKGVLIQQSNIGTIYDTQGEFDKAMPLYRKALSKALLLNDAKSISSQYANLATIFTVQRNFSDAESYYLKALRIDSLMNNTKGIAQNLMNLGSMYAAQQKIETSISFYRKALDLFEQIDNKSAFTMCQLNISASYAEIKNYKLSEYYLDKALLSVTKQSDKRFTAQLENIASQIYEELQKPDLALVHFKKYAELNAIQNNNDNVKNSLKAELNYEFEHKKDEIKFRNIKKIDQIVSENKIQNQLKVFLVLVLILLLVLLIFMKRSHDAKRKIAIFMSAENERQAILLQEVHHRINNNLQIISSLLSLQASNAESDKLRQYLEQSQNRIHSLSVLHELLFENNSPLLVNMDQYLRKIVAYHEDILKALPLNVEVNLDIINSSFPTKIAVPIALILNELLTNAIKYAFKENPTGKITIILSNLSENNFLLFVKDNGCGFPDSSQIRPDSVGLRLVNIMSRQIGGTLTSINASGAQFELHFKLNNNGK